MTAARSLLIEERRPGCYHLISRCVRRAFLCGDAAEHRRAWLEQGIRTQANAFAIDVLTYCVMSNHLHIVIRTDPEQAQQWSAREAVERWSIVFPDRDPATGEPIAWDLADIDRHARDDAWVAVRRARLASVSWFMRILKQRIARRANKEDGVTAHFWEGRARSRRSRVEAPVGPRCRAQRDEDTAGEAEELRRWIGFKAFHCSIRPRLSVAWPMST